MNVTFTGPHFDPGQPPVRVMRDLRDIYSLAVPDYATAAVAAGVGLPEGGTP